MPGIFLFILFVLLYFTCIKYITNETSTSTDLIPTLAGLHHTAKLGLNLVARGTREYVLYVHIALVTN